MSNLNTVINNKLFDYFWISLIVVIVLIIPVKILYNYFTKDKDKRYPFLSSLIILFFSNVICILLSLTVLSDRRIKKKNSNNDDNNDDNNNENDNDNNNDNDNDNNNDNDNDNNNDNDNDKNYKKDLSLTICIIYIASLICPFLLLIYHLVIEFNNTKYIGNHIYVLKVPKIIILLISNFLIQIISLTLFLLKIYDKI